MPARASLKKNVKAAPQPFPQAELLKIFLLIRKHSGLDLRYYKSPTILRRIQRRMAALKIRSLAKYAAHLKRNSAETEALTQEVTIKVTSFFRDGDAFKAFRAKVFPAMLKNRSAGKPVRIWVPGCCTGEEVYSLAIGLLECMDDEHRVVPLRIFGTDVSEPALEKARSGVYSEKIREGVSRERLERFFSKIEGGYQINKNVRALCTFARQDLTQDPPFSKLDLISCRNVLIYLSAELQNKIFPVFHYALNPSGFLVLGKSETIGSSLPDLFELCDRKNNVYRRKAGSPRPDIRMQMLPHETRPQSAAERKRFYSSSETDLQNAVDRALLQRRPPAAVVVNESLEVVQTRGDLTPYLKIPQGKMSFGLMKMARDEALAVELGLVVERARKRGAAVKGRPVFLGSGRRALTVTPEASPVLGSDGKESYFLVLLDGVARLTGASGSGKTKDRPLQREYAALKSYLKSAMEQQELVQQELRSANEEVLSGNEELQSTNEELETAKEELESTNEELTTVNEELEARNAQLSSSLQELRDSRDDMREAQRIAHFGSWRWEVESKRVLWSSEMYRICGVPFEQKMDFDAFLALVHSDDRGRLTEAIDRAVREGSSFALEHRILRADGQTRVLQARGRTVSDPSGRVVRLIGTGQDVTEARRAAASLHEIEERFRLLVESVGDYAIFMLDPEGNITTWNAGAQRFKGYTAEEAIGRHFSMFYTEEDRKCAHPAKELELALKDGVYREEGPRVRKDGSTFWAYVVITALRDASGLHVGFAKVTRDMTAQREAREALLESQRDLERKVAERTMRAEESERFYRFMADAVPQIMWTANAAGVPDYFNRRWYEYTGLDERQSLTELAWTSLIHPDDAESSLAYWRAVVAHGGPVYEVEYRLRHAKDGEYRWFLARALPLKDVSGKTVKWFGSCTDIHDAKMAERALKKKTEELVASNRELEQFAYVASHDLQEPLRKIIAFSDRLKERSVEGLGEVERDYFERMQSAARRMKTLIEDLLNFSRVTMRDLPPERVSLDAVVRDVLQDLEARISQTGAQITVGALPDVSANGVQMRQLFQNLIGNSLKFMKKDAVPAIEIRGRVVLDHQAEIQIIDNGIGFEEKYLDRIFKPFQRLHGRAEYEGTGIGLAICQKIVQRYRGSLTAHSVPGEGSTFVVLIPAA